MFHVKHTLHCALVVQPACPRVSARRRARPNSGVSYAPIAQRIEQARPKGEMGVQFPLGAPGFRRVKIEPRTKAKLGTGRATPS